MSAAERLARFLWRMGETRLRAPAAAVDTRDAIRAPEETALRFRKDRAAASPRRSSSSTRGAASTIVGTHPRRAADALHSSRCEEPVGWSPRDRAMELPVPARHLEGGARARRGVHASSSKPREPDAADRARDRADRARRAGLPPGVLQRPARPRASQAGAGARAARRASDKIAFTGSGPRSVARSGEAAGTIKRVTLELGGKSAQHRVRRRRPRRGASKGAFNADLLQQGRGLRRGLAPARRASRSTTRSWRSSPSAPTQVVLGDPRDKTTRMGPVDLSRSRWTACSRYVESGTQRGRAARRPAAGAREVNGGEGLTSSGRRSSTA